MQPLRAKVNSTKLVTSGIVEEARLNRIEF
jgi:hypothetical protein